MLTEVLLLGGCVNKDEPTTTTTQRGTHPSAIPEYTKGDDKVFYIAGFTAPPKISEEQYRMVADCGINYIYLDPWANSTSIKNEAQIEAVMRVAETCGVKIMIMLNNTHDVHIGDASDFTESGFVEEYLSFSDFQVDYTQYPAFGGFYAFDEPDTRQFEWIKEDYAAWKNSPYADYKYLVTMMSGDESCRSIDEFISRYVNEVASTAEGSSKCLSYDRYPLVYNTKTGKNLIDADVAKCLSVVSYHCMKNDLDFYNYIQTLGYGYGEHRRPSTLADIRWQIALSLAFGAKGVQAFTYRTLSNGGFEESMVTATGEPTDIYYFCQPAFGELHSWEEVYLSFDYKGTMYYDSDAPSQNASDVTDIMYAVSEHERVKSLSATRDLLVGTFKDENGYDGFSFCTYNDPYYQKYNTITMTFNDATRAVLWKNGERSVIDIPGGEFVYEIAAGDVLFVVPLS